jgi:hypothetical protein
MEVGRFDVTINLGLALDNEIFFCLCVFPVTNGLIPMKFLHSRGTLRVGRSIVIRTRPVIEPARSLVHWFNC